MHVAQRRQRAAGLISADQRAHRYADRNYTREKNKHKRYHSMRQQYVCRKERRKYPRACQCRSEPSVRRSKKKQRRIYGKYEPVIGSGDHNHHGEPEKQLRRRVEALFRLRRHMPGLRSMPEALHILPDALHITLGLHRKLLLSMPLRQSDTAVTGFCNKLQIVRNYNDGLFLAHPADQRCTPLKSLGILPCRRLVEYNDGLIGEIRHHQRQLLHLSAGERERMPVAAFPHPHAPQKPLCFFFKIGCCGMSVLQLLKDRTGEKLELRLLHDEKDFPLQTFRCMCRAVKTDRAAGRAVQSGKQLADCRFSAAVCADQADYLMFAHGKAYAG